MASIVSINVSAHKGTFKKPVASATLRIDHGLVGDAHAGAWHRQISLLSQASIDKMRAMGVPNLVPGMFAENITTEGIELFTLPVGTRLLLGDCLVEVTQIGKECHQHCEVFKKVGSCVMPSEGVFAKVISEGEIRVGDAIELAK